MFEILGIEASIKMIIYLMLSFSFFVGIMLIISQEAFQHFNEALQKEYGIKTRILPNVEDKRVHLVDKLVLKYRIWAGIVITIAAFILLMIFKV